MLEGLEVETNQEQQYQASDYLEQLKQQLLDYSKEIHSNKRKRLYFSNGIFNSLRLVIYCVRMPW